MDGRTASDYPESTALVSSAARSMPWAESNTLCAPPPGHHRTSGPADDRRAGRAALRYTQALVNVLGRSLEVASEIVRIAGARSPQPAEAADAEALLALREAASAWLATRGVRQWEPGEVGVHEVREQIVAGEWHVVREGGAPVAALRLLWQDEQFWGQQPPVAGYVHGLVVSQRHHGVGLGGALLRWAADQALHHGRSVLRLDCGEENSALRRYYSTQGFVEVGRRDGDGRWYSVVLLEQRLA